MKLVSLKHKKHIDTIFSDKGFSIFSDLVKLRAIKTDSEANFLLSVPNRLLSRAVDRNRIKRLMREVIRKHNVTGYDIALIYNSDKVSTLIDIDNSITFLFSKLK